MSTCCWKAGADRLTQSRVSTNHSVKKKMQHLWSAIEQGVLYSPPLFYLNHISLSLAGLHGGDTFAPGTLEDLGKWWG